jgi:hypothetical protein
MAAYTTIDDSEAYFQCKLYTGNNTGQSITFDGDTDMQPNMIWNKSRSNTESHNMWDSVRGAEKYLTVNSNSSESDSGSTGVSSFDSDGFTVGSLDSMNDGSVTYVVWCWKETADAGFDIVGFAGTGSARTVSHSLSAVPHVIIIKNRDRSANWLVYHHKNTSAPETDYLELNNTPATADYPFWNDTSPTSSVFSVGPSGANGDVVNADGENIITYLFTEKQGFSKYGTYSGNGNTNGTFVYTGFRPATVILKSTTSTNGWEMRDNKRPGYNLSTGTLAPSSSDAETTGEGIDIFSNGFKLRASGNGQNGSGNTYIYMAWAEAPFVNSNGVPCNAR